jgi:CBS domain-containing protein
MLVGQLSSVTSVRLTVIGVDAPLHEAAVSFLKPGIGLVVACHGNGEAAGVLSKSDLVRHTWISIGCPEVVSAVACDDELARPETDEKWYAGP